MLKIASWNVNSLGVRFEHLRRYLIEFSPDVLVLQETKTLDEAFPTEEVHSLGYQTMISGQKTYNGVAVLAKAKISLPVTDIPDLTDPQRRILAATVDGIRIINLYVVNGQEVGSEKYAYKLDWLEKVTHFIAVQKQQYNKVVVLGDFNIAPADIDTHDPTLWQGKILCSDAERTALDKILHLGFVDSFRETHPNAQQFSWWDYRGGGYERGEGLRIDLVLTSDNLEIKAAGINEVVRGWERPSDHAPAWVEIKT